jgi:leader peptidase (prepilin peptidase) / N-methyltransferase
MRRAFSNFPGWVRSLIGDLTSHVSVLASVAGGVLLAILISCKFLHFPAAAFAIVLAALVAIVVIVDARHFIIPNTLTLAIFAVGVVFALHASAFASSCRHTGTERSVLFEVCDILARSIVAGGVLLAVREVFFRIRGVEGLGLGDVKLAAASGPWLGWEALPLTLQLAVFLAVLMIAGSSLARRRVPRRTDMVPFGTCLAPGIWIAFVSEYAFCYF